jgi:steroid 5-alpha reductase family enzyme
MQNASLLAATAVLVYMVLWFFASIAIRPYDVADVAWGGGFIVAALAAMVFLLVGRALLVVALVFLWGIRLTLHTGFRNRDKDMSTNHQKRIRTQ